jgi:protein ImuB
MLPDAPFALVARSGNALKLTTVDRRARALGLSKGMTLADARSREPALVTMASDSAADERWLEQLARTCTRFSPLVALAPADAIHIDSSGVDHLFGGESVYVEAVVQAMADRGMTTRAACAPTAAGAEALARYADLPVIDEATALRALPVEALGSDADIVRGLHRAGLNSLGAISARPSASIAARFGAETLHRLRQILGDAPTPMATLRPAEPLNFLHRFAEPVLHQNILNAALLNLLQMVHTALEQRALGGRRFHLRLARSDGAVRQLTVEAGQATRDPAVILRLFDERIATLADPLDPGFGYDEIALAISLAEPLLPNQPGLTEDNRVDEAIGTLIDRISVRIGATSVCRLTPQNSHIPERTQYMRPAHDASGTAPWDQHKSLTEPPDRPLLLLDPPQLLETIAEVPDGPPRRFRWRGTLHRIARSEGPERIAAEWWRRLGGEWPGHGGLTRDYYRIEDMQGARYWVFRHGLYTETDQPAWYLHGLFA